MSALLFLLAVMALAFTVTYLGMRWAGRHRAPRGHSMRHLPRAPFRKRFAARCREVLGLPWHRPADGEPLDEREMWVLAGYIFAEEQKLPLAAEPKRARRQP